ncbi:MAG TPA: hypothetical protein PJ982_10325, partial [Lacipirellulaceae bacterium]|nr:hypothetical protein [Lacipirellulaceae bacterium]
MSRSSTADWAPNAPRAAARVVVRLATAASLLLCGSGGAWGQLININFTNVEYTGAAETTPATPNGPAGVWNNLTNGVPDAPGSYETNGVQL